MATTTEVTINNNHRYAVHIVGRRFRPGRPRTLTLTERQIRAVRGNPWLWIEGEDYVTEPLALETFSVKELQEQLRSVGLPVSGNKDELISRLEQATEEQADKEAEEKGIQTGVTEVEAEVVDEQTDDEKE